VIIFVAQGILHRDDYLSVEAVVDVIAKEDKVHLFLFSSVFYYYCYFFFLFPSFFCDSFVIFFSLILSLQISIPSPEEIEQIVEEFKEALVTKTEEIETEIKKFEKLFENRYMGVCMPRCMDVCRLFYLFGIYLVLFLMFYFGYCLLRRLVTKIPFLADEELIGRLINRIKKDEKEEKGKKSDNDSGNEISRDSNNCNNNLGVINDNKESLSLMTSSTFSSLFLCLSLLLRLPSNHQPFIRKGGVDVLVDMIKRRSGEEIIGTAEMMYVVIIEKIKNMQRR
jgi:hypothetical protein